MTRRRVLLLAAMAVAVVAGLAAYGLLPSAVYRLFGGEAVAHPPCEQLPSRAETAEAITNHSSLVESLTAVGDGVEVVVGTPCPDPDRALVTVRVANEEEEASVREVLGESSGFGVPATVERY